MELKEKIAQAIDMWVENEKRTDSVTNAVLAVLRDQEPVARARWVQNGCALEVIGITHSGAFVALKAAKDRPQALNLYAAPVPPAESAAQDQSAIEAIAHRTCSRYVHGERPQYVFEAHTLAEFVRRLGAPPAESAVPDGWRNGVEAVAQTIQQKADDYAQRFGHDDMGRLSFGQGAHAHAKLEYHSDLCELAEEARAMLATAPKPDNFQRAETIASAWPQWKQDYRLVPGAKPKPEGE